MPDRDLMTARGDMCSYYGRTELSVNLYSLVGPRSSSARYIEERRRKRLRREALARAEREFAVGRPLVDIDRPIVGGDHPTMHRKLVEREIERRQRLAAEEMESLMLYFADQCKLTRERTERMVNELTELLRSVGDGRLYPTHSTAHTVPTTSGTTIPRL